MLPLTLLAAQKISDLLTNAGALQAELNTIALASNVAVPGISSSQVVVTSASPEVGDKDVQLTYPRICLYSGAIKNTQAEKFRSLSGTITVAAEIWASANLATDVDRWIHFYVEAVTNILRVNIGGWGDGIFYSGLYDVQFQAPKVGGLGYVQSAKVTCSLDVSRN